MKITLNAPWLDADLGAPHRVLSWSITRPGFVTTDSIVWREVRNADLPEDLDVIAWYTRELAATQRSDAVAMLTSRDVTAFETASARTQGTTANCLATVGLSNAERIGTRLDRTGKDWGTINIALQLDCPLSDTALLETLSIVTQARTAAIIDTDYVLPTGTATGTGTDCIAVAAPAGAEPYAGLHTPVGEATGSAVYDAVRAGAQIWMDRVRRDD
jgi:adenosylcobinamide amidohydrolase